MESAVRCAEMNKMREMNKMQEMKWNCADVPGKMRDAEARAPGPTYLFKIHTRPTTGVLVL